MKNLIIAAAYACVPALAQKTMQVNSIYIFKDGKAYIQSAVEGSTTNKIVQLDAQKLPNFIFGSLQVTQPCPLTAIGATKDSANRKVLASNTFGMLQANVGKIVKLRTDAEEIKGTILQASLPHYNDGENKEGIALIKTATGTVVFTSQNIGHVQKIEFDGEIETSINQKVLLEVLNLQFDKDFKNQKIALNFLSNHIAWAPSYILRLDGTKYTLQMFSEISSGELTFLNTQIYLVDGYANFNINQNSRLSKGAQAYQPIYDDMAYGSANEDRSYRTEKAMFANANVRVSNESSGDFHIYNLQKLNMEPQQHSLVKILDANGTASSFHQCILPDIYEHYQPEYIDVDYNSIPLPVSRVLELKNTSTQPFLPAPVLVSDAANKYEMPVAHVQMPAIMSGGVGTVYLSNSTNIEVLSSNSLESRDEMAKTYKSNNEDMYYDKIQMKGQLKITNSQDGPITLNLKRNLQGEIINSNTKYSTIVSKPMYGSPNNLQNITWQVSLKPGETKTIDYTYFYYLRINH